MGYRKLELSDIVFYIFEIFVCAIMLFALGVMVFAVVGSRLGWDKSSYEYIDTLGYKGNATYCYTDDVLYCEKEDGTIVQVIQYKKLGDK